MQLSKSHAVCILNNQRVAVRHIYACFYESGTYKHVYLALYQPAPYIKKLFFAHSSVSYADIRFGHHSVNVSRTGIYALDTIVYIIHLPVSSKLLVYRLSYNALVMLNDISGYRMAVAGRRFYNAHIPYSRHSHIERSRNGRSRKRQHIDICKRLFQLLLVIYSEALFFIYYYKSEIFKLYIILNKPVSADNKVKLALLQLFQYHLLLFCSTEA